MHPRSERASDRQTDRQTGSKCKERLTTIFYKYQNGETIVFSCIRTISYFPDPARLHTDQYAPSHYGTIKARSSSLRPSLWPQAWLHNGGRDQHKFQIDTTHITQQSTLVTVDKIMILRLRKTGHIPTRAFQPKETYLAPSGFENGYPKSSFSTTRLLVYIHLRACVWLAGDACDWGGGKETPEINRLRRRASESPCVTNDWYRNFPCQLDEFINVK